MLDALHDALSRGAWPEALDHALVAWRATRSPELADLIDRITARCEVPAPDGPPAQHHLWWIQHGRTPHPDAVMVGGLLERLAHRADALDAAIDAVRRRWATTRQTPLAIHLAGTSRWPTNFQERCAILLDWEDHDPRISRAIVEALRAQSVPHAYGIPQLFDLLADRVVELGDIRVLPALELMITEPRGAHTDRRVNQARFAQHAKGGLEMLPPPRSPGPLLAACVAFLPPLPEAPAATRPDLDALWKEVAANPDDVGTRSVLGDVLAEAGDPRGDVIVLQCNAKKPGRPLRGRNRDVYDGRVKTLLRLQWQNWLGDLALVLPRRACEFRCGMLEVVTVGTSGSPEWVYAKARGHRELACVHTVRPGWIKAADFATFIAALPRFPHTIAATDPSVFEELAATSTPMDRLRRLELVRSPITIANDRPLPGWSTNGLRDALGRVGSLAPELRELIVRDHITARLFPTFTKDIKRLLPKLEKLAVDEPTSVLVRDLVADRTFEIVPAVR